MQRLDLFLCDDYGPEELMLEVITGAGRIEVAEQHGPTLVCDFVRAFRCGRAASLAQRNVLARCLWGEDLPRSPR